MKKQTKLEKRRKTVLGAVLGFGAVALLTTATATWIISVNQLMDNGEVSVTVDTVQNNAITLEVEGQPSIKLAETEVISGDHLVVTSDGLGNLTATFDSIKLTCGKSVIDNNENITINTYISYDGGANALNLADDADDVTKTRNPSDGLPYTVNGDHWTYVDLVTKNITIPTAGSSENDDGSYTVLASGENLKVKFGWGSFFNNKSPANYYNSIFKNGGDNSSLSQATVEDAANIESELTAMHTALDPHSITVTFEVVLPGAGA